MVVNPAGPINPGFGRPLDSYFPLTYRRPKPGSLSIQGFIYNTLVGTEKLMCA